MRDRLAAWIESKADWPVLTTSIAKKWLNDGEGLQDRGITRDLDWGVPVRRGAEPWPGMEGKVFYVWFDAPIEYIGATAEWADATGQPDSAWRRWWREDEGAADVRYVEFMAKDNIPFHTLSFPATLMGANFDGAEPWKLVDYIKGFNWLTYEGGKFSTSQGRGVFMDQALAIMPSDCWRWWLLANAPETSDSDFTWEAFQNGVNKDLADVLGNFVSRVTKFCRSKFGEAVPDGGAWGPEELGAAREIEARLAAHALAMEAMEFRRAAAELRAAWVAGNEYLQRAAPWSAVKTDPDRAAAITRFGLNLIRLYGIASRPFIPDASDAMLRALGLDPEREARWPSDVTAALEALPAGRAFAVPDNLFRKIEDEERAALEARFAGQG
jgi:methionyl-tRNA synthetase